MGSDLIICPQLKTPLPDTISWEPVQLATPAFDPKVGDDAREVGFGRTLVNIGEACVNELTTIVYYIKM